MLLFLPGCRSAGERLPDIRLGEDACAHCRMIINEMRFAAAYDTGEEMRKFDDIGCLIQEMEQQQAEAKRTWVFNYTQGGWLEAARAWYVQSDDLASPMGYGVAAVATKEEAEAQAKQRKGQVLRFDRLKAVLKPWGNTPSKSN